MKTIYVASPYRGDVKNNILAAKKYCNFVVEQGCNFYCPHLMITQVLDDNHEQERELGMNLGKDMLLRCDELWIFGSYISQGMQEEIEFAKAHQISVKFYDSQCLDYENHRQGFEL